MLLFGLCLPALGQGAALINPGPVVEQIQRISGQSIAGVNHLLQDRSGFIWLATNDGLLRFDGFSVKRFVHDQQNPNSLPHNRVKAMVEDPQGFLWLITRGGGLSRLTLKTGQFDNFNSVKDDMATLDSNRLNSIALADDNQLWIGSNRGINLFDRINLTNQRLTIDMQPAQTPGRDNIQILYQDASRRLWFSVKAKGLHSYHLDLKQLQLFKNDAKNSHSIDSNLVSAITQTLDGDVWVGTSRGLNRFNADLQNFDRYAIAVKANNPSRQVTVTSLVQDQAQRLWIGSFYNGVSVLEHQGQSVIGINQGSNAYDSLSAVNIKHIMPDSSGTLWFATANSGLVKLRQAAMLFEHQLSAVNAGVQITAVFADSKGQVWLGASSNLYAYNEETQQFGVVVKDIGLVSAIVEDWQHQLILNVGDKGIFKYNPLTRAVIALAGNGQTLPSNNLHSLAIDAKGTVWAGLFRSDANTSGLISYDKNTDKYVQHLDRYTVETILPLPHQVVIGTRRHGLQLLDLPTGQWSVIEDDSYDLSRIWQLYQDKKGRIWVATNTSGLALLDISTGKLSFFTMTEGLPTNTVRSIVEDQQGLLWLGTTKGVVRFDPDSNNVMVFGVQDGLRAYSTYPRLSTVTASGDVIMANSTALSRFSPTAVAAAKAKPQPELALMLSEFKLFNQTVPVAVADSPLAATINHTEALTLSYIDYWFSISFASSDYYNAEQIRYAYKMEGLTKHWIETDSQNRVASFISVPAGSYTFKVKASNPDGQFDEKYRSVLITINPPWWGSWQAKLLYVLIALTTVYALYYYRTRSLIKRAKELERSVEQRTATINQLMSRKEQMFANISHEFKTPLTLILTPLEAALTAEPKTTVRNKVNMAIRNGQRLLRMVEQLLELSRLDTFPTQKRHYYSLQQTLSVLLTSFEPLLREKALTMDCQPFEDVIVPSTADALEMILINLISNAIKYTPANGKVTITVKPVGTSVCITVIDTGIGISEQDQQLVFNRFTRADIVHDENIPGAGIGLALVKELVESLDGQITLNSTVGQGSRFIVTLPVSTDANIAAQVANGLTTTSINEIDSLSVAVPQPEKNTTINENVDDKPTILLIDDNADMLILLADTLAQDFYCISAGNGEDGLALAVAQIPDLIICDVMMPGISGYEVASRLKQEQLTVHIPVVLLTAKGDVDSRMAGWQQDVDDYLAKPFHPAELRMRIDALLSIRKLLKKRFNSSNEASSSDLSTKEQSHIVSDRDKQFIEQFNAVLDKNYSNPDFCREQAASQMHVGDHQLYRKLCALLDDTFTDILRAHRLNVSIDLFKTGLQIGQIAERVGFTSTPYFSKCFKARFGKTPKQYQKDLLR